MSYIHSDGDLITISDSSDVESAIQFSHNLKLRIFQNTPNEDSVESKHSKAVANVGAIRKELAGIRDCVIHLLDQLEISPQEPLNQDLHLQMESGMQTIPAVKPELQQLQIPRQPFPQEQQQGMQNYTQPPMQQSHPTIGSPNHSPDYQQQTLGQQRFQPAQTATSCMWSAQLPSPYPHAGYIPQPIRQPCRQPMPYNPQGSTQQQQPQVPPGKTGVPSYIASQQTQSYNPPIKVVMRNHVSRILTLFIFFTNLCKLTKACFFWIRVLRGNKKNS